MTQASRTQIAQINIKIDGTDVPAPLMNDLVYMEVDNTLDVPDMLTMEFRDQQVQHMDGATLQPGKAIEITMTAAPDIGASPNATLKPIFKGEITSIEPNFHEDTTITFIVRGMDKSHRLNRETYTRAFLNMKVSDIVSQIAREAGLSPQVDATSQVNEHLFQRNQTNLAFISELAWLNGYEIAVDDAKLHFRKPAASAPEVELKWGDNLISFRPRLSVVQQVNKVTVRGWDWKQKKEIVGQSTTSSSHPQIGWGKGGGQTAQQAFGAAILHEVSIPVKTQTEATTVATAMLDEINADAFEAEGEAYGNPDLKAGVKINVKQVGTRFGGKYVLTTVLHRYESVKGYRTAFRIEGRRPKLMSTLSSDGNGNGKTPFTSGVVIGIVTDNNDPENKGRVKVKFPWFDTQVESWWMRVMSMGAGPTRGLQIIPEINDEVIVAFERGDMNSGVVLGGVWNGKDAPPGGTSQYYESGKVKQRMWHSSKGSYIAFDDSSSKVGITISDANGKNQIAVKQSPQPAIESKSGGKYSVDAGTTAEMKSKTGFTIDGGTQVTVKAVNITIEASGVLTLKGGMVKIN